MWYKCTMMDSWVCTWAGGQKDREQQLVKLRALSVSPLVHHMNGTFTTSTAGLVCVRVFLFEVVGRGATVVGV